MTLPILLDGRKLKFECLKAWCLVQLEEAERMTKEGKGIECINTNITDKSEVALACFDIVQRIKSSGATTHNLGIISRRVPSVKLYYATIKDTVKKHFKINETWIPALLCLSILQEYTIRGYRDFQDIEFNKYLSAFESKENQSSKHYKCAYEIIENLTKVKYGKRRK